MMVWKMFFLFQGCILRFHVNLPGFIVQSGCNHQLENHVNQTHGRQPTKNDPRILGFPQEVSRSCRHEFEAGKMLT